MGRNMNHLDNKYFSKQKLHNEGSSYRTNISGNLIKYNAFDYVHDRLNVLTLRFLPDLNEVLKTQTGEL